MLRGGKASSKWCNGIIQSNVQFVKQNAFGLTQHLIPCMPKVQQSNCFHITEVLALQTIAKWLSLPSTFSDCLSIPFRPFDVLPNLVSIVYCQSRSKRTLLHSGDSNKEKGDRPHLWPSLLDQRIRVNPHLSQQLQIHLITTD